MPSDDRLSTAGLCLELSDGEYRFHPEPPGDRRAGSAVDVSEFMVAAREACGQARIPSLPEIDMASVDPSVTYLGNRLSFPLLISSMTGGDHATLLHSIRERIFTLDDDVVLLPGHGPITRVGDERRHLALAGSVLGVGERRGDPGERLAGEGIQPLCRAPEGCSRLSRVRTR